MNARRPLTFDFISTRLFLKAFDLWAQKHFRGYSRRALARWARIASPNFMTLIIQGKRKLSTPWMEGLIHALKLSNLEADYLRTLLAFESTKDALDRERLLTSMREILQKASVDSLAGARLELVSNPIAWTLYHLIGLKGSSCDAWWYKQKLREKISIEEIRAAFESLKKLSLIEKVDGSWIARTAKMESPNQLQSAENRIFHRYALQEALRALDQIPPTERMFGSLTIAVPQELEQAFKDRVNEFGRELLQKFCREEKVHGNLYRVNIQLYPLTHTENKT